MLKVLVRWPVLVLLGLGASPGESATKTEAMDAALTLATRNADAIEGSFAHAGSLVSFYTRLEGPSRAVLHLDVNSVAFDAAYDATTETLDWDGHNGALTLEDKEALVALSRALERSFTAAGKSSDKDLPLHEALLYRRVSYWAEAPVGLALPARTVTRPKTREGEKTPFGSDAPAPMAACQQGNEDGILRFANCSTYGRWLMHDATSHCMLGETINAGPGSNDCMGRCGPGCGCGWGAYTYDCGDHDRCCRVHGGCTNPWDSSCGDEFWEADDDFFWAWGNCWACRF